MSARDGFGGNVNLLGPMRLLKRIGMWAPSASRQSVSVRKKGKVNGSGARRSEVRHWLAILAITNFIQVYHQLITTKTAIMDITNENFMQSLPEITETIKCCDFIAIDTELSGLMRERSLNRFDLPEERFAKSVESSRGYFIMQFGLSCFTETSRLRYSNRTYNFYIFPQPHKFHGDINRTFSLQAHAIQFLSEHGFDFNKLFKHGVSYLTFQEKKMLTARLKSDLRARSTAEFDKHGVPTFVPASMTLYCRCLINKVKKFVETRREKIEQRDRSRSNVGTSISTGGGCDQDSEMTDATVMPSEDYRLEIRDCSSNHKRNVMQQVLECLPIAENLKITQETDSEKNEAYLVLFYVDKQVKNDELKNDLVMSKGFLEVIELIIVNKKPLVGHNLTLDLIQIINQFMEPLSDDYDSFKETCHSLFPLIYDTKYIAHSILDPKTLTNNQSRLNDLYCQLKDHTDFPKIEVEHSGVIFDDNQLPHQAGYDAYMSGYAFIVLCEAYTREMSGKKSKMDNSVEAKPTSLPGQKDVVNEFANRVHMSYSYDFKYFDLAREEQEPDRSHVFYMEFPSTWSLDDIFQVFSHFGGVEAGRLSKTSALCALRDKKQTKAVMKMVENLSQTNYKILTYESYLENYKLGRGGACGDANGDTIS